MIDGARGADEGVGKSRNVICQIIRHAPEERLARKTSRELVIVAGEGQLALTSYHVNAAHHRSVCELTRDPIRPKRNSLERAGYDQSPSRTGRSTYIFGQHSERPTA